MSSYDAPMGKGKSKKNDADKDGKSTGNKVSNGVYEAELYRLQTELVKLQEWVRATGARLVG